MFQRRVASSCGIPCAMWRSMHIMSQRQANRMLPPLVPIASQVAAVATLAGSVAAESAAPCSLTLGDIAPLQDLCCFPALLNAFLIARMIVEKMSTRTHEDSDAPRH